MPRTITRCSLGCAAVATCPVLEERRRGERRQRPCVDRAETDGLVEQGASAFWVVDALEGPPEFHQIRKIPAGFAEGHSDTDSGRRDPVMQHCRRSGWPLAWDRAFYIERGEPAIWEEQADHGLRAGIAFAMHLPQGRHFFVGVDRREALSTGERLHAEVAELTLFAAYAQQAASVLLEPVPESSVDRRALSRRELETLRWASAGKTAWETGRLLAISERTVVKRLANAAAKLACVRKQQAVAKALRLRLIT